MKNLVKWGTGTVITLLIGGTAYTISQSDVVKNFAADTGMTQQQAEQYVNGISQSEMASFKDVGAEMQDMGKSLLDTYSKIDCVGNKYEWESPSLSCDDGKAQLKKVALDSTSLGQAYIQLDSSSASKTDIETAISLISQLNTDFQLPLIVTLLDRQTIDDVRNTNSYNKAVLQSALQSN